MVEDRRASLATSNTGTLGLLEFLGVKGAECVKNDDTSDHRTS
jgi:hypothetical protein